MRIRIEIDGRTVLDTNVAIVAEMSNTTPYIQEEQPPEELLRVARARGAQSAGRASHLQEAGAAALTSPSKLADRRLETVEGPRTKLDTEAGRAVAADVAANKTSRARGAPKSPLRKSKKK